MLDLMTSIASIDFSSFVLGEAGGVMHVKGKGTSH